MRFLYSFLLVFLSIPVIQAEALDFPSQPEAHVNDYARIFSAHAKSDLEEVLSKFESKTTNQLVVATFESLEGEDLENFSIRLAEKWKIGRKEKDNGVIVLIFKRDRKIRIEVGYGLEALLPDALCGLIINREIAPYFKKGDYDRGIINGLATIIKVLEGEYKETAGEGRGPYDISGTIFLILFILIFILINYANYSKERRRYWGASSRGNYSDWRWPPGGGFGGGGLGGGFGGGGSFGGGGASGRW